MERHMKIYFRFVFTIIILITFVSCLVCTNEIIKSEEIDEHNRIILFTRDAGATTSKSLQISIIPINEQLKNKKGNICITNGRYLEYTIESNNITIFYNGELFLKENSFGKYTIKYEIKKNNKLN